MALTHQRGETALWPVDDQPSDYTSPHVEFLTSIDGSGASRLIRRVSGRGIGPWIFASDLVAVSAGPILLGQGFIATATLVLLFLWLAASASLYRSQLDPSALDDAPPILGRLTIAGTLAYVLSPQGTSTVTQLGGLGRGWWMALVISGFAVLLGRGAVYGAVKWTRRQGIVAHRTLIVGAGEVANELADYLASNPHYGLKPTAFYEPFPAGLAANSLPVITRGSLQSAIEATKTVTVVIAFAAVPESQLVQHLHESNRVHAEIFFVPRLFEVSSTGGRDLERIRALPVQRLRRGAHRSPLWSVKTAFDRVVAAAALALLSPLLILLALAVLISNGRPIFFRQIRVGLDGREFGILKFRTLPATKATDSDTAWAAEGSRKPTAVGSFMRAASLDELPQLVNILKGEMSFVGPRPERPHFAGQFASTYRHYNYRHRVPTGLTGLAQINGLRGDTSISERTRFDNLYVESWSLWGDVKIVLRTFRLLVVRPKPGEANDK